MTIITHDDGTGELVHLAYEGPYMEGDGALERAECGESGWKVHRGAARAEYLRGDLLSEWDTSIGARLVPIPAYEPTESERLNAEMGELLAYLSSTDWYAIRLADTGEEPPLEVSNKRQEARNRISEIRELLKTEE